jgi:hypothetical protein
LYHPNLDPTELVWGSIRNRVQIAQECISTNVREKQIVSKKGLAEYTKEKLQNCWSHVNKTGILAMRWLNRYSKQQHDYSLKTEFRLYEYR